MPLVDVQLQGGPCNGNTETVAEDLGIWPPVYCGGHTYNHVAGSSNPVRYRDAGPTDKGIKAPRAHTGWHDLQRSINHNLPRALKASQRNTQAALQAVSRGRKVRV